MDIYNYSEHGQQAAILKVKTILAKKYGINPNFNTLCLFGTVNEQLRAEAEFQHNENLSYFLGNVLPQFSFNKYVADIRLVGDYIVTITIDNRMAIELKSMHPKNSIAGLPIASSYQELLRSVYYSNNTLKENSNDA